MQKSEIPDMTLNPEKLKNMSYKEVEELCALIREMLIKTTSVNGGHLAPNLGVVELTVAMHRVFDSPHDRFVFDVGHQCYTHKILTGRADRFDTIRTEGGLAGFPKPSESEHDPVVTGHSSTSISAACGLARAKSIKGEGGTVVAVIGDGALTGGLAYEGLNNAGRCKDKIVVILNDNKMSISKNVGAMARYLAVIRTKSSYIKFKNVILKVFGRIPVIGKAICNFLFRSKSAIKNALYRSTLFDALGLYYIGPVDGYNQKVLEQTLSVAKELDRPCIVHVCTVKGKGYGPAERYPKRFHGIGKFDVETGEPKTSEPTFSDKFGKVMCDIAAEDDRLCAITAAMKDGTGLGHFAAQYHKRFYDCGIAEEHAVTYSSGLAAGGMKPVFAVYSSFIQRAFDQIVHDVAIQGLGVTFAIDRAGVVGEDGETHHGLFDCSMLNCVPGMTIYSPCYFDELELMLRRCVAEEHPSAIRYPRGVEPYKPEWYNVSDEPYQLVGADKGKLLVVSYGRITANVLAAYEKLREEGIDISVLHLSRVKPIDEHCKEIALGFDKVHFFEEGVRLGGIGENFLDMINERGFEGKYYLHAVEDKFVTHAKVDRLLAMLGLDAESIYNTVKGEIL
ncbi:MAG: 1-deoxy-D-xylulose-5-phosphate synthase [Clostridia bacterium]|nr:1-deoxy-D-xylulose-5-phosphate synthase [Clostridia bacterium]